MGNDESKCGIAWFVAYLAVHRVAWLGVTVQKRRTKRCSTLFTKLGGDGD